MYYVLDNVQSNGCCTKCLKKSFYKKPVDVTIKVCTQVMPSVIYKIPSNIKLQ